VGFANGTVSATAKVGPPFQIIYIQGQKQTAAAGSYLASPVVAKVVDLYKNGVPGVTVYFSASNGGVIGSSSAVTGANGLASTTLQLPTTVGTVKVITSSSGIPSASIPEYSVAGPPATINITGGNNQSALAGTQLPQPLSVFVSDQYGNPVSGNSVTFSDGGAGGSFSNINPVISTSGGTAAQAYTLPASSGKIIVQATANGLANSAVFTETAQ
jgi:adhesin/invasin